LDDGKSILLKAATLGKNEKRKWRETADRGQTAKHSLKWRWCWSINSNKHFEENNMDNSANQQKFLKT